MWVVQRAIYATVSFFSRVLPLAWTRLAALFVAEVVFLTNGRLRDTVISNIQQVRRGSGRENHKASPRRQACRVFRHFALYLVEFFRCRHATDLLADGSVVVEGIEHLDQALAGGRGVVVVTAHLGNWETGGAVLAALGYPVNAGVFRQKDPYLERLFQTQREARGYRSIMVDRVSVSLVKRLRRKEIVVLLADWDMTGSGYETEFFGRRVTMPRGPSWLSFRTGAPIVPGFGMFCSDHKYHLHFECPINPDGTLTEAQIQEQVRRVLESEIGTAPDQWLIFHDFWQQGAPAGRASR